MKRSNNTMERLDLHALIPLAAALHEYMTHLGDDPILQKQVQDALQLVGPSGCAVWEAAAKSVSADAVPVDAQQGRCRSRKQQSNLANLLIIETQDLLQFANTMIQSRPYHTVKHHHRVLYQVAAVTVACAHVASAFTVLFDGDECSECDQTRADSHAECFLIRALHALDEAIIVTGLPLAKPKLMAVVYHLHDALPALPFVSPLDPDSHPGPEAIATATSPELDGLHRFPPVREITVEDSFSPSVYRDMINTPFVIRDAIQHWPALQLWTPEYLNTTAGHRLVPVELGSTYLDSLWSQQLMTLNQFLRKHVYSHNLHNSSEGCEPATVGYLAQYNLFALLPHLRSHITVPDQIHVLTAATESTIEADPSSELFPPDVKRRRTLSFGNSSSGDSHAVNHSLDPVDVIRLNAWFGPRGTVTPLHHDGNLRNMFAQVVGSKRIVLFPPSDSHLLTDLDGLLHNTSSVDVRKWPEELKSRPELEETHGVDVVCHAGDLLYIPPNYWHHVESLATSFSVSFWF